MIYVKYLEKGVPVEASPVLVKWLDAQACAGWETIENETADGCPLCTTLGFLVYRDEDHIVVASTIEGENMNTGMKIPVGMIKSITTINIGEIDGKETDTTRLSNGKGQTLPFEF